MSVGLQLLAIAIGGGLGATCRYLLDSSLVGGKGGSHRRDDGWPVLKRLTLINVLGSVLLGLITGYAAEHSGSFVPLFFGTGFCGGFTTFSTVAVETILAATKLEHEQPDDHHHHRHANGARLVAMSVMSVVLYVAGFALVQLF